MSFLRADPTIDLPEDAVCVLWINGQSNTEGTSSFTSQLRTLPPWGIGQFANGYEWDKIKRGGTSQAPGGGGGTAPSSAIEYTSEDRNRPPGQYAIHRFQAAGTRWGRGGDEYWWEGQTPNAGTLTYTAQLIYSLVRRTRRPVYGMRAAVGGTRMYQVGDEQNWNKNTSEEVKAETHQTASLYALSRDKYYGDGMRWIRDNVVGGDMNRVYMLGVVWFLGAADASNTTYANAYEANCEDLFDISGSNGGFRTVVGGAGNEDDVPVVVVRSEPYFKYDTGEPHTNKPGIATVRTAQANLVTSLGGNAVLVSSDDATREDGASTAVNGTPLNGAGEHINALGHMVLGERIAAAIEDSLTPLQAPQFV